MPTILLLGATSSIAEELAKIYARKGYQVQLAARHISRLVPLQADLTIRFKTSVELIEFDAEDMSRHGSIYDSLDPKPDIVVCIFGFLGNQSEAEKDWIKASQILNVNYVGAVSILNLVAQDFMTRKNGTIVGISSVAGDRGRLSNYLYGSAKAGFTAYLSGLRNRLFSHNVHVVTVKPGFIRSRMTANIETPGILTASPKQVASAISKAVDGKKNLVYTLWMWRWIMLTIRSIPDFIFKRLKL